MLDERETQEAKIKVRVDKTIKLYFNMNHKFIGKKEIERETKMKIFKTIFRPVSTFGCESWIFNKRQIRRVQAVEVRYLWRTRGVTDTEYDMWILDVIYIHLDIRAKIHIRLYGRKSINFVGSPGEDGGETSSWKNLENSQNQEKEQLKQTWAT